MITKLSKRESEKRRQKNSNNSTSTKYWENFLIDCKHKNVMQKCILKSQPKLIGTKQINHFVHGKKKHLSTPEIFFFRSTSQASFLI